MIIIEGADKVGKSTFANELLKLTGFEYRHMTKPPEDFDHVAGYMDGVAARVVQDRYHLGASVYGQMLGLGGFPTYQEMRIVQRYLRWQGAVVVILSCEDWRMEELLAADEVSEEMYDPATIRAANRGFRALTSCSNHGEPWCDMHIDVTDGWPDEVDMTKIVDLWKRRQR